MDRLLIALAMALTMLGTAEARTSRITQGKLNSIEACSACHQVQPSQAPPPPVYDANYDENVPAPSFMAIAAKHGTDIDYLRKHITEPEWPMREQMFEDQYLQDIVAYIGSLESNSSRKHRK